MLYLKAVILLLLKNLNRKDQSLMNRNECLVRHVGECEPTRSKARLQDLILQLVVVQAIVAHQHIVAVQVVGVTTPVTQLEGTDGDALILFSVELV